MCVCVSIYTPLCMHICYLRVRPISIWSFLTCVSIKFEVLSFDLFMFRSLFLKFWMNAVIFSTWLDRWLNVLLYKINAVVYFLHCCYLLRRIYQQISLVCLGNSSRFILFHIYNVFNSFDFLFYSISYNFCSVQFLVSKLVTCCVPAERKESLVNSVSSALSLLHMLTLDSDPTLHDYVKVSFFYSTSLCCFKDLVLLCFMDA